MEEIKLTGEYEKLTKKKFNRAELLDIRQRIIDGHPIHYIAKVYKVDRLVVQELFKEFILTLDSIRKYSPRAVIGNKNTSYLTEEEMLAGPPVYTLDELSKLEKHFYLNYGKENDNRDDSSLEPGI